MSMRIYYVRDLNDPQSDHWTLYPAPENLRDATKRARAGYADPSHYPEATGFRIINRAGDVLAEEARLT